MQKQKYVISLRYKKMAKNCPTKLLEFLLVV